MQELILLVGNVGCGKSFLAKRLTKRGAIAINNDALLQTFHGGEYTYDSNLKEFYHECEREIFSNALMTGRSIVVDRTNMDKKSRQRFIEPSQKYPDLEVVVFDFGPGTDISLQRRLNSPKEQTAKTWTSVHKMLKSKYEKPSFDEDIHRIYEAPSHFKFWGFDFDGTITEENIFPKISKPRQIVIDKINELSKNLSNIIIIWSCRSDDYENQMREWLDENNIYYDFINENPIFDIGTRKIFCHAYIDDRAAWIYGDQIKCCIDIPIEVINYDESVRKINDLKTE